MVRERVPPTPSLGKNGRTLITFLSSSFRRNKNVSDRLLPWMAVEVTAVTEVMEAMTTVEMEAAPEAEAVEYGEVREAVLERTLERTRPSRKEWRPPSLIDASQDSKDTGGMQRSPRCRATFLILVPGTLWPGKSPACAE